MARPDLTPPEGLQVGDVPTLTLTLTTAAGSPATVSTDDVTVRVKAPGSPAVTVDALTLASTGVVTLAFACAASGRHHVHAEWADAPAGAGVDAYFDVGQDYTA
jgi:hypothetical protein